MALDTQGMSQSGLHYNHHHEYRDTGQSGDAMGGVAVGSGHDTGIDMGLARDLSNDLPGGGGSMGYPNFDDGTAMGGGAVDDPVITKPKRRREPLAPTGPDTIAPGVGPVATVDPQCSRVRRVQVFVKRNAPDLRTGKWSREETVYTRELIQAFEQGLLRLREGTTLRSFLSQCLYCVAMRITKKFKAEMAIGKKAYRKNLELSDDEWHMAHQRVVDRLQRLRGQFIAQVRQHTGKDVSTCIPDADTALSGPVDAVTGLPVPETQPMSAATQKRKRKAKRVAAAQRRRSLELHGGGHIPGSHGGGRRGDHAAALAFRVLTASQQAASGMPEQFHDPVDYSTALPTSLEDTFQLLHTPQQSISAALTQGRMVHTTGTLTGTAPVSQQAACNAQQSLLAISGLNDPSLFDGSSLFAQPLRPPPTSLLRDMHSSLGGGGGDTGLSASMTHGGSSTHLPGLFSIASSADMGRNLGLPSTTSQAMMAQQLESHLAQRNASNQSSSHQGQANQNAMYHTIDQLSSGSAAFGLSAHQDTLALGLPSPSAGRNNSLLQNSHTTTSQGDATASNDQDAMSMLFRAAHDVASPPARVLGSMQG